MTMTKRETQSFVAPVKAALAEVGYPAARVAVVVIGRVPQLRIADNLPREVIWTALMVARFPQLSCWACWKAKQEGKMIQSSGCEHDPFTSRKPRLPKR